MRSTEQCEFKWLVWIFLGGECLTSLSINYVGMSKDMGERLPQLYYIKTKISYNLGLLQSESPWKRNDAITFFLFIFVFLCTRSFFFFFFFFFKEIP